MIRQRATPLVARSGEVVFAFHRDAAGQTPPPMIAVPSQYLERLLAAAGSRPETSAVVVTGQVFAYAGRNYLLLTVPAPLVLAGQGKTGQSGKDEQAERTQAEQSQPAAEAGASPGSAPTPAADPDAGLDEAVRQLIDELESGRDRPRVLAPMPAAVSGTAQAAVAQPPRGARDRDGETAAGQTDGGAGGRAGDGVAASGGGGAGLPAAGGGGGLLPEGTIITRRRARLVRQSGGTWAAVFTNGTATPAQTDPPLTIAPCLNLERLEAIAAGSAGEVTLELSGRVLVFRGRNLMIPTLFEVTPPTELRPIP